MPLKRSTPPPSNFTRPFLKWAGGKYRLLTRILGQLPPGQRLVEPFAGSAVVYLNSDYPEALVCDLNRDLIALYQTLQRDGEAFIRSCQALFTPATNQRDQFYAFRDAFNRSTDPAERGVLLLYLNRHAFNGLVRYNAKGFYNAPFGRYKAPYFPHREMTAFYDKTLRTQTTFATLDFRSAFQLLSPGDVVYGDPPYVPLSATASFTAYAGNVFSLDDQVDLARLAQAAAAQGVPVVLSNHDTELTRNLYAAARAQRFHVCRTISCHPTQRHPAPELLALFAAPDACGYT